MCGVAGHAVQERSCSLAAGAARARARRSGWALARARSPPAASPGREQGLSGSLGMDSFSFSLCSDSPLPWISGVGCTGEIYSHICLRGDWTVTEFFKPTLRPNRKAENKWLKCQASQEKSMPGYTDMTDRSLQFSRPPRGQLQGCGRVCLSGPARCPVGMFASSPLSPRRKFTCHLCDRSFTEKWALNNHMKLHTGGEAFKCTWPPATTPSSRRPP